MKDGRTSCKLRAREGPSTAPRTVSAALSNSTTERILGVHVCSDLKRNAHTDIACGKVAKVLFFAA
jgi:hypothetical protein